MKTYYGRMKIDGKWLDWHKIDGVHETANDAKKAFMQNTRFSDNEIDVTDVEPKKYFGRIK
jgi:hypothetical protein